MSDSKDFELEIVNPQLDKDPKKKKERSFAFNRRRNPCQATPKCGFLRRKRQKKSILIWKLPPHCKVSSIA